MTLPLKDRLAVASVTLDFLAKIMRCEDDDVLVRSLVHDVEWIGTRVRDRLKAEESQSASKTGGDE